MGDRLWVKQVPPRSCKNTSATNLLAKESFLIQYFFNEKNSNDSDVMY